MSTDIKTIFGDLRTALRSAREHVVTYFLANLGMAVLMMVMFMIIAIPIILVTFWGGMGFWFEVMNYAQTHPLVFGTGALILMLPFSMIFFTALGSLFGLTKNIVESGEGRAESVFSWFRGHFISFASAGIILSLVIIFPMMGVGLVATYLSGGVLTGIPAQVYSVFNFVWAFFTIGLTLMVYPALVNDMGVQAAFSKSFHLAIERFDRVYGLVSAVFLIGLVTFLPTIAFGQAMQYHMTWAVSPLIIATAVWSFVSILLWLLLLFPMTLLAITRMYHEFANLPIHARQDASLPLM